MKEVLKDNLLKIIQHQSIDEYLQYNGLNFE